MSLPFAFLPQRRVLELSGPDTIEMLERLVTHATDDWPSGEARYGALLTPQGKVLTDYLALRTETGVLLDVDANEIEAFEKRLKMFRLRSKVEIAPRADLFVIAATAASEAETLEIKGASHIFGDPRFEGGRSRAFANSPDGSASLEDYHHDRISNGVPEQGHDFGSADVFPADINMDLWSGVDLKKGCFVGQEVVSRMHRRGKIRKRTVTVKGRDLGAGQSLMAATPIGDITSSSEDVALARVRTDRLAKAIADKAEPSVDDQPVTLGCPDWLMRELESFETS